MALTLAEQIEALRGQALQNPGFIEVAKLLGAILTIANDAGANITFDPDDFSGLGTDVSPKTVIKSGLSEEYFEGTGEDGDAIILKLKTINGEAINGTGNIVITPGEGGGSQTPLLQDVDADGYKIDDLGGINVRARSISGATYTAYDPLNKGTTMVLSNTNHTVKASSGQGCALGLTSKSSGKIYFEVKLDLAVNNTVGLAKAGTNTEGMVGDNSSSLSLYTNTSGYLLPAFTPLVSLFANNDIIGVLVNFTDLTVSFQKNGVDIAGASMDLEAATAYFPAMGNADASGQTTTNFGATAFAYPVPTGYTAGWYSGSVSLVDTIFTDDNGNTGFGTQVPAEKGDFVGNINVSGTVKTAHLKGTGSIPSINPGAGAGGSPTVSISGSDMAGVITVTTGGASPTFSAAIAVVTFNIVYGSVPKAVIISPANPLAARLTGSSKVVVDSATGLAVDSFTLSSNTNPLLNSSTYKFYYLVIE